MTTRPSPFDSVSEALPERIGPYAIRAKIADGGMATIYAAQREGGGLFALKVIKPAFAGNPEFVTMFRDEARIICGVSHPSIVRVFELGDDGGQLYMVMELLEGQSLWACWDALRTRGVRMPFEIAAHIGARAAEGLGVVHAITDEEGRPLSVVHRDVNPSNLFLTYDGAVKLIDFGLVKAKNRLSKTAAGIIKGKLAYMSPEQAQGDGIDHRTDIFALGITLWEISVDRRLFKAKDDIETLRRVHAAVVPAPETVIPGYPGALSGVLLRSLARAPEDRFQRAEDFAAALDACARGGPDARAATAADVAAMMRFLFADEQRRLLEWLAEANAAKGPSAMATLSPPSTFNGDEEDRPPSVTASTLPAPPFGLSFPPAAPAVDSAPEGRAAAPEDPVRSPPSETLLSAGSDRPPPAAPPSRRAKPAPLAPSAAPAPSTGRSAAVALAALAVLALAAALALAVLALRHGRP